MINNIVEIFGILSKTRMEIIIGITGLLIGIIIFIAEIIANKDVYEILKKAILNKLEIQKLLRNSCLIILLSWFISVFEEMIVNDILYVIIELIITTLILLLSYNLVKVFYEIISIHINESKKMTVINEYLEKIIKRYYQDKQKYINKSNENKEEIYLLINNNSQLTRNYQNDYNNEIKSNKRGYIESFDITKLKKILKNNKNDEMIYIRKLPGDYVESHEVLFYTNYNDSDELLDIVNINTKREFGITELKKAFKDIIDMANNQEVFDENNIIKKEYLFLLENNYSDITKMLYENLFSELNEKYRTNETLDEKDLVLFKERMSCLLELTRISTDNKNDLLVIIEYIHHISIKTSLNVLDTKAFAYYYINDILNHLLFINKNDAYNKNIFGLYNYIIYLVKNKKLEEIKIIINNLYINDNNKNKIEEDIYFIKGIIKLFMVLYQKDSKYFIDKMEDLKIIFNGLCDKFINDNYNYEITYLYNILYNAKYNEILNTSHFLEFMLLKDEYSNSYCGWVTNDNDINIYTLLCIDERHIINSEMNTNDIKREYYYDIKSILDLKLDENLCKVFDVTNSNFNYLKNRYFNEMYEISKNKEYQYIINLDISNDIVDIKNKLSKELDIYNLINEDYLITNHKDVKTNKVFYKSEVLDKLHFKNIIESNIINYKNSFINAINSRISDEINKYAKETNTTFDEYILSIDNHDNYVIFTDKFTYYKLNNKGIKVYSFIKNNYSNRGKVYLVKKNNLPIIDILNIDDKDFKIKKEDIINKYQYINIEILQDDITFNGEKLTEEEKKKYVKLSIMLAFDVRFNDNSEIIKFKYNE